MNSILITSVLLIGLALPIEIYAANLRLSWIDNSNNETGFKVKHLSGETFAEIATVGANITSYTDSGLTDGAIYCYQVSAFNSGGSSAPSNQACASASYSVENTVVLTHGETTTGSTLTSASTSPSSNNLLSTLGGPWADYRLSLKIKSSDNDAMGVMFRYIDNHNYYRFSWDKERKYRRLEKFVNGVRTVLAENAVPYVTGQTYQLQIVARGATLEAWIDGSLIFSVIDASFDTGTIALYSWYNWGASFDDVLVEDLLTKETLLWDDFDDSNFTGWTTIDEGTLDDPSAWSANRGVFVQNSNIGSNTTEKLGTFALYTKRNWGDYRVTLKIKSSDDDAMGVMFRYVDNRNYYRFSWDQERRKRHLEKFVNGGRTVLAEDAVPYVTGQTYQLQIVARGTTLEAWIDGSLIFSVIDSSLDAGTIALYSWLNRGSAFDDVLVEDLVTKETLLWDDFDDDNFTGWTIIDEGTSYDPSAWSVSNGVFVQNSNIGSSVSSKLGTFAIY